MWKKKRKTRDKKTSKKSAAYAKEAEPELPLSCPETEDPSPSLFDPSQRIMEGSSPWSAIDPRHLKLRLKTMASSHPLSTPGASVLLISDAYDNSALNRQVAQIPVAAGAKVYSTVLQASREEHVKALRDGVQLILPEQHTGDYLRLPSLDWLTYDHRIRYPDLPKDVNCIVGHADITDTAAKNIKDDRYPHADLIMFTHVLPAAEDTDYYKGARKAMKAWEKESGMLDKVDKAKAVFSVGMRIYLHFHSKYRGEKKPQSHHIFLPKPSEIFLDANVSRWGGEKVVLSIGRVRKVEKLKGHDLVGESMREVVKIIKNVQLRVRGISEDDRETSQKILEDALNSGKLKPTLLPYGTQEDIRDDMEMAHLVVMPSRSEPFGLVGLEAIAAGIPVLISNQTGLADMILGLIKENKLSAEHRNVIVETSVNDRDRAGDARRWAVRIVDVLEHSDSEFEKAARFKRELLESRYWEESHNAFLQACTNTVPDPTEFETEDAEMKNPHNQTLEPIELAMADPEMRALYNLACEQGFYEVFHIMLMLVGKKRNGKSSLMKSLLRLKFNPKEKITNGIVIKSCLTTEKDNWKITEEKRDADSELAVAVGMEMKAMQEQPTDAGEEPIPGNAAAENIDDEDDDGDDKKVEPEREEKRPDINQTTEKPKPLGPEDGDQPAKGDARGEETFKQAARIVKGEDDIFDIVGSKEHPSMSIWDFAGQEIFFSNHHVLYSPYAIYILTLDLTKGLDDLLDKEDQSGSGAEALQLKTEGDLIDYHLESIRAHTRLQNLPASLKIKRPDREPLVIVVGTHKDQVKEPKQEMIDSLFKNLKAHLEGKAINEHVHDRYFAIDNTKRDPEDPELSDLRAFILDIAQKQSHMGRPIPISWLELKAKLMEMEKQGTKYCSLQDVIKATGRSRVPEGHTAELEKEVAAILRFFHLCGDILYFDTPELRNFVVLDPQWFVDVQKTIITIPEYRLDGKKSQWDQLEKEGVLEDTLVDAVWGNKKKQEDLRCDLIAYKNELLKMMEQFDLVLQCSPDSDDETGTATSYFVPSLLTATMVEAKLFPKGPKRSKPIFVMFNDKFFPIGLYHRLVIDCMRRYKIKKKPPLAYANCARFFTDTKRAFAITKERHYLKLELLSLACFSHGPGVREGMDEDLMQIIKNWIPGIGYKWCFCCCCEEHKKKQEEDRFIPIMEEDEVEEWFGEGETVCDQFATTTIEEIGLAHWYLNPRKGTKKGTKENNTGQQQQPSSVPESKPVVVMLNDEYGTAKGGISTIHRQMGRFLVSKGAKVYSTVLGATPEDKDDAKKDGVELIFPTTFEGDTSKPGLDWLTFNHRSRFPDLPSDVGFIVGHVNITSRAARLIKKDRLHHAKLVQVTHVIPEDVARHKSEERELRIKEERSIILRDLKDADVIVSVGPRLFDYYQREIRGKKPHEVFLPEASDIFKNAEVTYVDTVRKVVLSIGRVKGVERLKGYDLTGKTMVNVIEQLPDTIWRVCGISREDFAESKAIIQANMKGKIEFTPLAYCTQEELREEMEKADVVLMPSRAEPFGLVGLEAIAAGVPVLVSNKSGLAWFLKKQDPEFDRTIVEIDYDDDKAAETLTKRVIEILKDGPRQFQAAQSLRKKLFKSNYWVDSHAKFLEIFGL